MEELRDTYIQKCTDFVCEPVKPFTDALDVAIERGEMLAAIELNGNSKALFNKRIEFMQVFALGESLRDVTFLRSLDLSYNFLDDNTAGVIANLLKNNKSIQYLNLEGNKFGAEGATKIAEVLSEEGGGGGGLLALNLNQNPIGEEGAMELAKMLCKNTILEVLDVGNAEVGHKGVISIATALNERNRSLLSLNIENPRIFSLQEETTLHVARMLAVNSTLVELKMGKCKIRDMGAHTLVAYGLVRNQTLQHLDLRCNEITEVGGEDLGRLLTDNATVQTLGLACNKLGDGGCAKLAAALPYNHTTHTLDLGYNGIGDVGLTALAESLAFNSELGNVRLWGNEFGQTSTRCFMDCIMNPPGQRDPLNTDFMPYSVGELLQVAKT